MRYLIGLAVMTTAMFPALAPAEVTAETPAETASRLLRETLAADGGPGMMAAVVRDGCVIWSDAAGYADLEQQIPLTTDTRMRIGSVSKPLTAALVLRLIQQGRMDPDADIRTYVPAFPDKGAPITARQLAAHTSGIRHYDFASYAEANNTRYYERLEDALAVFAEDDLLAAPGSAFAYSSLGYNLLGIAAAAAAGSSFGEALATHVTKPLGLENTVLDHPLMIVPRRTRFYTVMDGRAVINTIWRDSSDYYPSGGILSTAEDLARFTHAVFGGDFLEADGHQLVRTEATTSGGQGTGYTFGWQIETPNGTTRYEHGGLTNGACAQIVYIPDTGVAAAGVTNYNFFGQTLGETGLAGLVRDELPGLFSNSGCVG